MGRESSQGRRQVVERPAMDKSAPVSFIGARDMEDEEKPFDTRSLFSLPLDGNLANWFHERLQRTVAKAQTNLEENQQLQLEYYTPAGELIVIEDVGYWNPDMILLYGVDQRENHCTVVINKQCAQFVLRVVPKSPEKPGRHIGFIPNEPKA